jgi:hypothetical protein
MVDHPTVMEVESLKEQLRASKDVMHAGNPVWMVVHGDACVGDILFLSVVEKAAFSPQIVGRKDVKEFLALGIPSGYAVISKHLSFFVTGMCTNTCIDVAVNDDLGGRIDSVEHGIKDRTEFIVALVIAWKVCQD